MVPSSLPRGWRPALRSMMVSRRWPRTASFSAWRSASSGPRCARASIIALTRGRSRSMTPPITPQIPHMLRQLPGCEGSLDGHHHGWFSGASQAPSDALFEIDRGLEPQFISSGGDVPRIVAAKEGEAPPGERRFAAGPVEGNLRRPARQVPQGHRQVQPGPGKAGAAREGLDHLSKRHDLGASYVEDPAVQAAGLARHGEGIDHLVDVNGMPEIVALSDVEEASLLQ